MTTAAGVVLARWLGPWVREVGPASLRADLLAGLLGAALAVPQAIAFAALAGLPPSWGLMTAIVPGIVAALAGSSRHVVTGPTNAVSLALAATLAPLAAAGSPEYLRLVSIVTLGVGLLQFAIGALRLGVLADFLSPAVLLGFTSGAALLIAAHAIPDLAGLPADVAAWPAAMGGIAPADLATAAVTLAVALALRRWAPRAPGLLIALLAGTAFALGARLAAGGSLPPATSAAAVALDLDLPPLRLDDLRATAGIALALTVVSLGQSIAIAKALAARSGQPLDIHRECRGQGLANLAGALSSCFVASGSLNRSLPNLESGARTPLAAVFGALGVAVVALLAMPWVGWLPAPAIAALLLLVAASLIDLAQWRHLLVFDRREAAVAGGTLAATLALPLDVAILAGVAASLAVYLHRSARPALRTMGFVERFDDHPDRTLVVIDDQPSVALPECPQLKLLRMEGAVYFGAAAHIADRLHALRHAAAPAPHLLVMARSMNFIDWAGAQLWEQERLRRRAMGGDLYFHQPRPEVIAAWRRTGFLDRLGDGHVFVDKTSAIAAIVPRLDEAVCAGCRVRVFAECARRPGGDASSR